jgi:quinol monooxygenase YgiN
MVQFTACLTAVPGRAHQTLEALHALRRGVQSTEACSAVSIAADVDHANAFWYREDWADMEALRRDLQSDRCSLLVSVMETCDERPIVELRVVTEIRGLDYVAAVRESSGQGT